MKNDFDYNNINLDDYKEIDITLDDIKKEKMKRNLRSKIRKNSGRKKIIAASVALLTLATTVGITSQPVFAQRLPILDNLYKNLGFYEKYLPESHYVGKTVEGDGVKVTLDSIIGTKHVIKVAVKVEGSGVPVFVNAKIKGVESEGSMGGSYNIDDNTQMMVMNLVSRKGFPNRGKMEINIGSVEKNLDEKLTLDVDFTNTHNKSFTKEFDTEIVDENRTIKVKGMEATPIGTLIEFEGYEIPHSDWVHLKVDNKIYMGIGGMFGDEKSTYVIYPQATYDEIKDFKDISLIQEKSSTNKVLDEELDKLSGDELKERYKQIDKELTDIMNSFEKAEEKGISYTTEIVFNNGNKAEIYDMKRENGIITAYLKGDDSKQLLALTMKMDIIDESGKGKFLNRILETDEGYAVEFNENVGEVMNMRFSLSSMALTADNISDEIMVNIK